MRETRRTDISKQSGLASLSKLGRLEIALGIRQSHLCSQLCHWNPSNCTAHCSSAAPFPLPHEFSLADQGLACSRGLSQCAGTHTSLRLLVKNPTKLLETSPTKATGFFVKRWPGVQNTNDLGTSARAALHITPFQICLDQGLFLHRQITFHTITDFQFSLWSRHRKFRAETNGLWGRNKNALLSTTY